VVIIYTSKDVGINCRPYGAPYNLDSSGFPPLGMGHTRPLQSRPCPRGLPAEFDRCRSNSTSNLRMSARKKTIGPRVPPFNVTQLIGTDTDRSGPDTSYWP